MRYEAKSEREALGAAAKAMGRPAESIPYRVVRDEKSFWGGRVVEIEVEEAKRADPPAASPPEPAQAENADPAARPTRVLWRDSAAEESFQTSPPGASAEDEETWDAPRPPSSRAPRQPRRS